MTVISRQLPATSSSRTNALQRAKQKRDSLPGSDDTLRTSTRTRLDGYNHATTGYAAKVAARNSAEAVRINKTTEKNQRGSFLRMVISHLLQVFNFMVDRGDAPAGDRVYYGMTAENPVLPETVTDQQALTVAAAVETGEANRVLAGGTAMTNPAISQIISSRSDFQTSLNDQSNLNDALDLAQEAVENEHPALDGFIKILWDEVESKYANETKESQRENAREWGVIFVTRGTPATVRVKVTNPVDDTPREGALLLLVSADVEGVTDVDGAAEMHTSVIGPEILRTTFGGSTVDTSFDVSEGGEYNLEVEI